MDLGRGEWEAREGRPWTLSLSGLQSFVQIYVFIKDPNGGLRKEVKGHGRLFVSILIVLQSSWKHGLGPSDLREIAAPIAFELTFMAHCEMQHASYPTLQDMSILGSCVDTDYLGRSEFATPATFPGKCRRPL